MDQAMRPRPVTGERPSLRMAAGLALASASLAACAGRFRYDVPREVMRAPNAQTWGVGLLHSRPAYSVASTTVLNGGAPLREKPTAVIASGAAASWQWRVVAVPSVVPLWTAWRAARKNRRIRREAERTGNRFHTAVDWDLALERAYRVVQYLYGSELPPMRVTLLLIPDGTEYRTRITETGNGYFPVTLAFYWPPPRGWSRC